MTPTRPSGARGTAQSLHGPARTHRRSRQLPKGRGELRAKPPRSRRTPRTVTLTPSKSGRSP
ncbi:hypothetical protein EAO69_36320 [Streptomyces sp. me109]|nr:hypothetical protein EAO69_36320 [Streptomyces sp. me109]